MRIPCCMGGVQTTDNQLLSILSRDKMRRFSPSVRGVKCCVAVICVVCNKNQKNDRKKSRSGMSFFSIFCLRRSFFERHVPSGMPIRNETVLPLKPRMI